MKFLKKYWYLFLIVFAIIIYFYWNNKQNTFNKSQKQNIEIGAILPLTGEAAPYGISEKNGILTALEKLNSDVNNKFSFKVFFEDSEGKPKNAISAFEKLKTQYNVPAIIGPISSPEVLALAPVAEKQKTVILSPGASAPKISNAGDYIFRNVPSDIYEPKAMADFITNSLKLNKIAIIYVNNDYGVGVFDVFKNRLIEKGGKLVESVAYDKNTKDFRTQLLKIKNSEPNAVYFIGYKELGLLIKQADELKINCQYLSNSLFEDPDILKVAGESANGMIFTTFPFDISSNTPKMKEFVSSYEKIAGKKPDGFAAAGYEALLLINQAIQNTNEPNSDGIKNGLYAIKNYNSLFGNISFDQNGDVIFPISLKKVENNKFIKIK